MTTQDPIANMPGVPREGVAVAAGKLEKAGLIRYSRGRISILGRRGLEASGREYYAVIRQESDRLLTS